MVSKILKKEIKIIVDQIYCQLNLLALIIKFK